MPAPHCKRKLQRYFCPTRPFPAPVAFFFPPAVIRQKQRDIAPQMERPDPVRAFPNEGLRRADVFQHQRRSQRRRNSPAAFQSKARFGVGGFFRRVQGIECRENSSHGGRLRLCINNLLSIGIQLQTHSLEAEVDRAIPAQHCQTSLGCLTEVWTVLMTRPHPLVGLGCFRHAS